jgi:hypothetical protein
MNRNCYEALVRRRDAATLTWRGPASMLFARAVCAIGAQALVAAVFATPASRGLRASTAVDGLTRQGCCAGQEANHRKR